ncbi:hypothetical protein N7592_06520 [Pseudomonas juntendi]|jgi:hypothetical protein|uniref:Uncharacterized protein n=2 Tax=Pseudomonas TaxID=286 RepID=A0ABX9B0Q8_9PSED|nr:MULTISPECIES: hypothetical protein [Pseudomonas]MBH3374824.1 hypothetical protein [Pseudomonas juntendi]MBH3411558.1 hypothetical protein [Pseudomonas putida]MBS3189022.1 hypothetical protein [Pseudomonas sp. PCH44]MCE0852179.1 hypothetical protein [Pseudomonas asiatica]MCE0875612.1 hypothetical protein [Pseudomonas monteilii]
MKILFALNLLILVAAVILGDIVFGACAFIGLSGFAINVLNRKASTVPTALPH